jgi:uncharacterized protein (DUF2164 family)
MIHKKQIGLLNEQQRQIAINEIIDFFATERDEQLGIIAAQDILDMFLENIAKTVYNKGVDDTRNYVTEKLSELETNIELQLKK